MNNNYTVRYFEQDGQKRTQLPNVDAFEESLEGYGADELKNALGDLREKWESGEERAAFDSVLGQLESQLDKVNTSKDMDKVLCGLRSEKERINAEISRALDALPKDMDENMRKEIGQLLSDGNDSSPAIPPAPEIPETQWTPNQRKKITKLNASIRAAWRMSRRDSGLTKKTAQNVYKAYHAARLTMAHSWSSVPLEAWNYLWEVFSAEEPINVNRLAHVSLLARDMSEAKVILSPSQQLLTIEAVFVDGWESKAIENWRRCMSSLGDDGSEIFKEFWELGVRMYCRLGDLPQAEHAVSRLLERRSDPHILLPLIRACSEEQSAESRDRAWSVYRVMRELLGPDMNLSDYDQVVSSFLTTGQTENALYAFVDMMSDGRIDLKHGNHKRLPSVVANKFFLGKWLKRLIGAGDLDGAHEVVVFMRKRGVSAAPIQLNGLVGAWQRSGSAADLAKADELAWNMIESRINFVRARKERKRGTLRVSGQAGPEPFPRATLETFSLLAENYRVRQLREPLEQLWQAFREAEMRADAFMINQLLESSIQAGQWKEALSLYHYYVTEKGVAPDPYTFSALWKTLGVNRLLALAPDSHGAEVAATRRLFAETVNHKDVFMPEGMDGQLARKILHSFRRLPDHAGLLLALTALKDIFKFLPPESLVLEMVLGTTKLSWSTASQRRFLMAAKRDIDRCLEDWAGGDATKLEGDSRGEALYEYLRKKYWPMLDGLAVDQRAFLADAASQMGVCEVSSL